MSDSKIPLPTLPLDDGDPTEDRQLHFARGGESGTGFRSLSAIVGLPSLPTVECRPKPVKLSPTKQRVVEAAVDIRDEGPTIAFQHSTLCQTYLPYSDPGDHVRVWDRENGSTSLRLKAGEAKHPTKGWLDVGLPFGPKPRLILSYLNTQAIIYQKPEIDVEDTLTAFVKRVGLDAGGRTIRTLKDQLTRLSATEFKIGRTLAPDRTRTGGGRIVLDFDLWFPKDENQRIMWPTRIMFSQDYFASLLEHAVPLDARALGALAHSAMALDIYAWLSQRLHRIDPGDGYLLFWSVLHSQFGQGFSRLEKFKEKFRTALDQVLKVYPAATVVAGPRGLTMHRSAPPVPYRVARRLAKS